MAIPRQAWGNTSGWVMAILVTAGCCITLLLLGRSGATTPPTVLGGEVGRWSDVRQPTNPALVLGGVPGPAEAGSRYRSLADRYVQAESQRHRVEDFLEDRVTAPDDDLPFIDELIELAGTREADLFARDFDRLVAYDREDAALDALYDLGSAATKQATLLAGEAAREQDPAKRERAEALLRGAYALGLHLYRERLVHRQLEYGYRLMSGSLATLAPLAEVGGDAETATRLRAERAALAGYVADTLVPVWSAIGAIQDGRSTTDLADVHAGDVRVIAASDEADRLWRTEALLRLGVAKFDAARPGDREAAAALLAELSEAQLDDPVLRRAASLASDLTLVGARGSR